MEIEFDPKKSRINSEERGLSFEEVEYFDWDTANYEQDTRKDYTEPRFVALGYVGERLHVVCFTPRHKGRVARIISFRKANRREVIYYEKKTTNK